jgi:predicted TIM-barrel fold metal-dependent hydrolase
VHGLEEAFNAIARHSMVSFDTALVPSAEVVAMVLQIVGSDRVMYGSDAPLHLIRSVVYTHPQRGERLITEHPYHWVDSAEHNEFKYLAHGVVHAHWQALYAIKNAIEGFPEQAREGMKRKIFYENAKSFYSF